MTESTQQPQQTKKPSTFGIWWNAVRPHTLTASMSPCLVGGCCCFLLLDAFPWKTFCFWQLFCILIQIGTNLHNDVSDYIQGADTEDRVGQARAVQKGWISATSMMVACSLVLVIALGVGIIIMTLVLQEFHYWFAFIIVSSIVNAFAYTGGPWPLGYLGLPSNCSIAYSGYAEIVCFLYFGWVATLTIPYLEACSNLRSMDNNSDNNQHRQFLPRLFLYATQVGCLASAILVVNNLRDRKGDARAGKRTLVVQYGPTFGRWEYTMLIIIPYSLVVVQHVTASSHHIPYWIPFLSLPFAYKQIHSIHTKDGKDLNIHVGMTAMLQLCFCILLCFELWLSTSSSETTYNP